MKRRQFLAGVGAGTVAAGLAGCGGARTPAEEAAPGGAAGAAARTHRWKMVTTWPPNFPGLGTGANHLAERIQAASGGRIRVQVYAAGELVPAFEVFDAVSQGTAQIGHGGSYYWKGKVEAAQLFGAIPFGMTPPEIDGWLYYGDGLKLWQEIYEPFGLVPFPVGNTGVQMGGWFNKPIESIDDLKGLKMRIPGLGGEVLRRAGGTPVSLPGGEIFTALQTGSIDATEWVGPSNDLAFGLHRAARYYYYPGWHETGPVLECTIGREAWDALSDDLKSIVRVCCQAAHNDMLAEFSYRDSMSLEQILTDPEVELRRFPDEVLAHLRVLSEELLEEMAARDEWVARIYGSYREFQARSRELQKITNQAYLNARDLGREEAGA